MSKELEEIEVAKSHLKNTSHEANGPPSINMIKMSKMKPQHTLKLDLPKNVKM